MPFHAQPRLSTPRLGRFGEDRSSVATGPSPGFGRGDLNRFTNFGLGAGTSSFQFPGLIDNSGTLPSQGGIPGSQPGQIPFFFNPNSSSAEENATFSGLRLPQPPEHQEPFSRTQGFDTGREFVGTSLAGSPIFSHRPGAEQKIRSANLDVNSPTFINDLAAVIGGLDPGNETLQGQDILERGFFEFNKAKRPEENTGGGGASTTGASEAGGGSFVGQGLPQESVLNESLVGLIGSLIQSLITSGQFATGGGVSPAAPQALFRTDLDRLGANRF